MAVSQQIVLGYYKTAKTSPKLPWPQTTNDHALLTVLNFVPDQLFNFIAWASVTSPQPSDNERVKVTLADSRKIMSTCQDIITMTKKRTVAHAKTVLSAAHRVFEWS